MKYNDVKTLSDDFSKLIAYGRVNKISNTYYSKKLNEIEEIISKEIASIEKSISPELKNLEKAIFKFADENIGKELDTIDKSIEARFRLGFENLSEEDKKKHTDLYADYTTFMELECDMNVKLIDLNQCPNVDFDYDAYKLVKNFLK